LLKYWLYWQSPPPHVIPALQAAPPQQSCPAPPQPVLFGGTYALHVPDWQVWPLAVQAVPVVQQGWLAPPQVTFTGGTLHVPYWQAYPELHALPAQHVWLAAPQGMVPHMPHQLTCGVPLPPCGRHMQPALMIPYWHAGRQSWDEVSQ
jgi:hypothetical protein